MQSGGIVHTVVITLINDTADFGWSCFHPRDTIFFCPLNFPPLLLFGQ